MKRKFILLMMIFALIGGVKFSANAQETITIGDANSTTFNANFPFCSSYKYTYTQQIYRPDFIKQYCDKIPNGKISKIKYHLDPNNQGSLGYFAGVKVYMRNSLTSVFSSKTAWDKDFSEADIVFSGSVDVIDGTILFDLGENAFAYDSTMNLIIHVEVDQKNGAAAKFKTTDTGKNSGLYYRNNNTDGGISNSTWKPASGNIITSVNVITLTFSTATGGDDTEEPSVEVNKESIDFGDVAVGNYWSEKGTQSVKITASNTEIKSISSDNNFFVLPDNIDYTKTSIDLTIGYDKQAAAGEKTGNLRITYGDSKTIEVPMSANAYSPVTPDIWELPHEVKEVEFNNEGVFTNAPTFANLHDNYILPNEGTDGTLKDAVYKFTIDNICLLSLNMSGNGAFMVLYKEEHIVKTGPSSTKYEKTGYNIGDNHVINTFKCDKGTYYLVAAATNEFTVNITKASLPLPGNGEITYTTPEDGIEIKNYNNNNSELQLNWNSAAYVDTYKVFYGTDRNDLKEVPEDIYRNFYYLQNLTYVNNTRYYWQVKAINTAGTTEGPIYSYYTTLSVPQNVKVSKGNVYPNDEVTITWKNEVEQDVDISYNVYIDAHGSGNKIKHNDKPIRDKSYTISNLDYTPNNGHAIYVTAVYDLSYEGEENEEFKSKESAFSNSASINVTGYGSVSGTITDSKGNPLAGVAVSLSGTDEFANNQSYELTTNADGIFEEDILVGNYTLTISHDNYEEEVIDNVVIDYNNNTGFGEIALTAKQFIFIGKDLKNPTAWNVEANWSTGDVPADGADVIINANAVISSEVNVASLTINKGVYPYNSLTVADNGTLTVTGKITQENDRQVILVEGGQIFQKNEGITARFKMDIEKPSNWETAKDGWQFISMPMTNVSYTDFTSLGEHDLYKYDGSKENEWLNYKEGNDFEEGSFKLGHGYLATLKDVTTATVYGTLNVANPFASRQFTYIVEDDKVKDLSRFHLVGNPFTYDIKWSDFNIIGKVYNIETDQVEEKQLFVNGFAVANGGGYKYHDPNIENSDATIKVGQGFFVKILENYATLGYQPNIRSSKEKSNSINVIASGKAGQDNVVINFAGQSEGFDKLQNFNKDIATVFVANNGKRYGIANVDENVAEVELSFVASQMGHYSISLDVNGEFETVTLVDRFTGIETNMLLEDEYNFTATSNDSHNRFVVRLANGQEPTANSQFVYQSGEELILSIEGSVQIVDMLGRVVYYNEHANGDNRINVAEFNDAAYVVRVVNEEGVKVQKVVIY